MHSSETLALGPTSFATMAPHDVSEFHRGTAAALDRCYREHFEDVRRAVGRVLHGADEEAVVHQVFYRLISDAHLRAHFRGGNFAAWITTIARNEAIDHRRRNERALNYAANEDRAPEAAPDDGRDAKLLVERFVRERLPEKLRPLFEARFLRQLSQREAAKELAMHRTTLAYQETQIRQLLHSFFLEEP